MIQVDDTVRVISQGIFCGQEVKVLKVDPKESHERRSKDWYLLDTKHEGLAYQGWFTGEELELVEAKA
jgi:hypothetical protein